MPTGEDLLKPVKKFVSEYFQMMVLGTGPRHLACAFTQFARDSNDQPVTRFFEINQGKEKLDLEQLWQALFDEKMASGALNQARIAKCSVLVSKLENFVQKWEMAQQLDAALEMMNAAQQVNALQHAGVQWYHEEFISGNGSIKLAEPIRYYQIK